MWYVEPNNDVKEFDEDCEDEDEEYTRNELESAKNFFTRKSNADREALRRKSMAKRWMPKVGEKYYVVQRSAICDNCDERHSPIKIVHYSLKVKGGAKDLFNNYWIGNINRTEDEAKRWYEAVGHAFLDYIDRY